LSSSEGILVRLAVHDLLGQHEALLARVGRQGMQWTPAGAGVAGPLRGFAVDRDQVRCVGPDRPDPGVEALLEGAGVERIDDIVERVMARHAARERADRTQGLQVQARPTRHLDHVVRARQATSERDQQDLVQPVDYLAPLARVLNRIEKVQNRS
jgi:hypothetical protein